MHLADILPSLAVTVVVIAFLIIFKMKAAAQPDRIQLAEKGKELLMREDVTPVVRRYIEFWLDHAFGLRLYLVTLLFALPFALIFMTFRPTMAYSVAREIRTASEGSQKLFHEFDDLGTRLLFANNPILVILALIEIVVVGLFLFIPLYAVYAWMRVFTKRVAPRPIPPIRAEVLNEAIGEIGELSQKFVHAEAA